MKTRRSRTACLACMVIAAPGCTGASLAPTATPDAADASASVEDGGYDGAGVPAPDPSDADTGAPPGEVVGTIAGAFDTHRAQIADVVPVGDRHFVVGFRDPSDRLTYARWDTDGRLGGAELAGTGVQWMRADSTDGFSRSNAACTETGLEWINTLAIQEGGDTPAVRLDVHRSCGGALTFTSVAIGAGVKPSAVTVTGQGGAPARTLVVYGRGPQLLARFVVHGAAPDAAPVLEDELPILRFTLGSAFSTDVIHNRHSDRFIIGFIQRGGLGCSIWNVTLDPSTVPPAIASGPTQFGGCDGDQGGHHTSVAYNPRGDGRYAWWRQDMNLVKAVFIHDASGAVTPARGPLTADVVQFGNIWTAPVASTGRADPLYVTMFGQPSVHLFEMDASGLWTDRQPTFGPTPQAALRVLPSGVVGLVRVRDGSAFVTGTLRLLRAPLPAVAVFP